MKGKKPEKLEEGAECGGGVVWGRGRTWAGRGGDADLSSVQDLTVTRGHQAMFFCTVNFQLPKEEITYSWKFAGGGVSRGGSSMKIGGGLCFTRGWGVRMKRVGLGLGSDFVQGEGLCI